MREGGVEGRRQFTTPEPVLLRMSLNKHLIPWEMKNIKRKHYDTEPKKLKLNTWGRNARWLRQGQTGGNALEIHCFELLAQTGAGQAFSHLADPFASNDRQLGLTCFGFCPPGEEELPPKVP